MSKIISITIMILIFIILVLASAIVYEFFYKDYEAEIFQSGQEDMLNQIIEVVGRCEQIPIQLEEGTITITIVAAECLQQ